MLLLIVSVPVFFLAVVGSSSISGTDALVLHVQVI